MAEIVVAGHLCLDLIPPFLGRSELRPGKLIEVGAMQLSTGGCVSNVGRALHRLGVPVRLVARLGDDAFGDIVYQLIQGEAEHLADDLIRAPGGVTSYSVVLNPPGQDRIFLHMPGENDEFTVDDLPDLTGAKLFHFGYPPLMAKMYEDRGDGLKNVLSRAKDAGLTVSLDMSLPDVASPSGRAPWGEILKLVLPFVDLFFPSYEELAFMLNSDGPAIELADECLNMGAGTVVVKCGEEGLVAKSVAGSNWAGSGSAGQALDQKCFPVRVAGTTGAGDATIAGFLKGFLDGGDLRHCLRSGCAVGAYCVEAPDAVSGIQPWGEVERRLKGEWAPV